jgi:hypothetical protein
LKKVNHILIGAGRSGTTTFVRYLNQHPEISNSFIKEVPFFSILEKYHKGTDYFHSFFENSEAKIISTCDTYLHFNEEAIKRVVAYNPDVKLSFILRDPARRAFSNYQYAINNGHQTADISFIDSQAKEAEIIEKNDFISVDNLCHFYTSLYHQQIKMILKYVRRENLFICTLNELQLNPEKLFNAVFEFLSINPHPIQKISAKNRSAKIRFKSVHKFLQNPAHPLRKALKPLLQIKLVKQAILKSKVVDGVHEINKIKAKKRMLNEEEIAFCDDYFRTDLADLKAEFKIDFN